MKNCGFILLLLSLNCMAQKGPSVIDMAFFYQPENELRTEYMYSVNGEFLLKYHYRNAMQLSAYLVTWKNENSKETLSNDLLTAYCTEKDCILTFRYDTLKDNGYHTVILRDEQAGNDYIMPIYKAPESKSPIRLTDMDGKWISDKFVSKGTEVLAESLDNSATITVFHYDTPFGPADPPTGRRISGSTSMIPDSVFSILSYTGLKLDREGLYLFQTDTTTLHSYTIRVESSVFPEYATLPPLAEAMQYITSRSEWKALSDPGLAKREFDQTWLDMAGTLTNAKAGIKYYFTGIYGSNRLFTTYKPGWKTDKGMIYTIFGIPHHVRLEGFTEIWEYDKTLNHGPLSFTFSLSPNIFSPYHAILHRDSQYQLPWNRTIDRLRRGTPNEKQ